MYNELISLIVPIYKVEDYLAACIDSLTNQTYQNIEILLVNDGSPDGCNVIMESYAEKDSRIRCLYKENGGLSDARNYGLKYIKGTCVAFIDSDDTVSERYVDLLYQRLLETDSDVSVCDMKYIFDDHESYASGGDFDVKSFADEPASIFINNSACNKLFKADLFKDILFPKGLYYEDLATIPLVLAKARRFCKVNEALYYYYQRGGSIAHTVTDKIFDIYKAIRNIEDNIGGIGDEIRKLYIRHGLFLTTLRIKDSSSDQIEFWQKNIACLDEYYPQWRKDKFTGYSFKEKLIFKLLSMGCYRTVKGLYRK